ncbi:MAG: glutaredoxin [Acidobacteria bacterium]|nr:glutaredoxin [Acidobacteriota bacterium]
MALVIYSKPGCPYCDQARDHYNASNIEFIEYDAQNDPDHQRNMLELTNGDTVVPVIVEDGVVVQSGWGSPPRGCVIIPA